MSTCWQECCIFIGSPSLTMAQHGKRHTMHANKPLAVSDGLNQHSLGTMSVFGCLENLA